MPGANQYVVFGVLKLNVLLSPAGTVTEPAGADVSGLAGSPFSHQVTGGDEGAVPEGGEDEDAEDGGAVVVGTDVELGAEAGAVLGAVVLTAGAAVVGVPIVLPPVVGSVAGAGAAGGAVSRATVAATGSDEGATLHLPASAVPCCPERVAAAT